eukprot:6214540-Pleurochrysis_carterae.AAC.3
MATTPEEGRSRQKPHAGWSGPCTRLRAYISKAGERRSQLLFRASGGARCLRQPGNIAPLQMKISWSSFPPRQRPALSKSPLGQSSDRGLRLNQGSMKTSVRVPVRADDGAAAVAPRRERHAAVACVVKQMRWIAVAGAEGVHLLERQQVVKRLGAQKRRAQQSRLTTGRPLRDRNDAGLAG